MFQFLCCWGIRTVSDIMDEFYFICLVFVVCLFAWWLNKFWACLYENCSIVEQTWHHKLRSDKCLLLGLAGVCRSSDCFNSAFLFSAVKNILVYKGLKVKIKKPNKKIFPTFKPKSIINLNLIKIIILSFLGVWCNINSQPDCNVLWKC